MVPGPVSAVIANLCMENFEGHAITTSSYKPRIWKRYVDDTELRSTMETSDSPVPRPPPFQSRPTTPDTSHSGTKYSLLIVTLITTRAGSKRQFI